jgi:hypothetical protein
LSYSKFISELLQNKQNLVINSWSSNKRIIMFDELIKEKGNNRPNHVSSYNGKFLPNALS